MRLVILPPDNTFGFNCLDFLGDLVGRIGMIQDMDQNDLEILGVGCHIEGIAGNPISVDGAVVSQIDGRCHGFAT